MDVFDVAAGVAAGVLLAALVIGSMLHIHRHEIAGTEERLWAYAGVVMPLLFVAASLYLAM